MRVGQLSMTMPCILRATLLFLQEGFVLGALVKSHHRHGHSEYSYSSSDSMNLTTLFHEMKMSTTTTIISGQDMKIDHIIRTSSQETKTTILDLDIFASVMSSEIASVRQYDNLEIVKRNLNFLLVADIEETQSILNKAQQLDDDLGAGLLLRHFSKWLVVLTKGNIDALIIDDIVLDNVAITTVDNVYGNLCKNISLLQTMLWKNASRQLQPVSYSVTDDVSARVFPNTRTGLNGRLLKVATLPWPPCNNETGVCFRLMSYLSDVYNFSYIYVEPEDRSWGIYSNGSWDGIIGLLVNETVDISAVPYGMNLLRSSYVTYLHPISYTSTDIIYKKPDASVNWSALLSCFTWQVYVCGLVILVGVTALFLIFKRITAHFNGRNKLDGHQTIDTITSTIGVACNQGSSFLPNTMSQRILLSFWWLFCIIMLSVYSGNLIALLAVTKETAPFTGVDNLLDSGYDIGISGSSHAAVMFGGSNHSVYEQIWRKSRQHQSENRKYHITRLSEGRYAYISDEGTIESYMKEKCDMAHTKERKFQTITSLIVPKHSPLALLMDPELMFLVERGIIDQWDEDTTQNKCSSNEKEGNSLELKDLFTALVVAGCGVGLAAFVLLFEICTSKAIST